MTPPPSKKRCRASLRECEDKITETPLPCPTFTTPQEPGVNKSAFNGVMFGIGFWRLSSVALLLTDKVAQAKGNQWMTCYLRRCGPYKLSGGVPVVSIVFLCVYMVIVEMLWVSKPEASFRLGFGCKEWASVVTHAVKPRHKASR